MPIIDLNARFGAYPTRHRAATYEQLSTEAEALGVNASVICSNTAIFFDDDEGNQETLSAVAAQPKRLIAAATINPAHTLDPQRAIEDAVTNGFKIVRFFPDEQGWPIDFVPFTQCIRHLAKANLPVMISSSRIGDATLIARLILSDGGQTPVLDGVTAHTLAEAVAALRDCPNLQLETHALLISGALAAVSEIVGAGRIVFGSGAAAQSLGASLSYVKGSTLGDAEKEQVLGGNVAALLHL